MLKTLLFGIICAFLYANYVNAVSYYGTRIGALSQLHHGVSGEVYAVDSRTIFLKNFNYDGEGPAAYFYVGNSRRPSNAGGFRLRDERGSTAPLKRYRQKDITLSLPEGKTLRDVKWFSVWCDDFSVNFGDVTIPKNLEFPRPHKINALNGVHGVSSDNIVIVDAQTLLIPNFSYDGEAPDAKFWVGRGPKPSPQGVRIPDENGKENPLRRYDRKTIVLTLPGDLTIFDIGHFGVWCEAFTVDFGHVRIPEGVNVPPSLKMLGISPQSKLNCEVLYDDLAFEVRWAVAGESIVVQLVAKLDEREYMSFGISPDLYHTKMVGADVAVAWVEKETGKGYAYDYFLDAKSQCSGTRGSCPDTRIEGNTNSIRLLNAAMVNGYSIVTYQRPLKGSDLYDLPIFMNGSQAIVWAIGPLNQRNEVSYHSKYTKGDRYIDFGRQPYWNCPMPDTERPTQTDNNSEYYNTGPENSAPIRDDIANRRESAAYLPTTQKPIRKPATPHPAAKEGAWEIPPIQCYEPEDGVFYAQMGPTGGKHGYPAITGHVGWGISWYINGLLIPEINVVRGKTYTFVVEGGFDPDTPAKYHPFYITDDPVGGYEHKTDEERANIRIFAGAQRLRNGEIQPTGTGRLCNWTPDPDGPPADEYSSFGAYQRSLTLKCDAGEPGVITWTPDHNTPDTVYYHCFTHRYLGWRINVHDTCDDFEGAGSEIDSVFAEPELDDEDEDAFVAEPSIRHETKIKPGENFLIDNSKQEIMKKNTYEPEKTHIVYPINVSPEHKELEKNLEISKLINDGIKVAEELESSILNKQKLISKQNFTIFNEGESVVNGLRLPEQEIHVPFDRPVMPTSDGLPVFLRPPQNYPPGPLFRPVKLPVRRPLPFDQTRPNGAINRASQSRPVALPQPSMIVNHYKKPPQPMIRPYMKNNKPMPIKSIASVLLLGEPTEIPPQLPQTQGPPTHAPIVYKTQQFKRPPTYIDDTKPMSTKKIQDIPVIYANKDKKPFTKPQYYEKPILEKTTAKYYQKETQEDEKRKLPLAVNTGFQPGSVQIEGGFVPIVRRSDDEFDEEYEESDNRRKDEILSDIDEAIESDALLINREPQSKYFEPMFIPSPLVNKTVLNTNKAERLTGDLSDMEIEDGEDKIAVAAERQDTYYLPPDNRKAPKIYPEGTVVAYDGKAVLDTSLVNSGPSSITSQNIYADVSRTEQLIRDTPQFVPFRGEIPPLSPDFVPRDTIQFTIARNSPSPVTEYINPLNNPHNTNTVRPISTKLTLLRSDSNFNRSKRSPHHTPHHKGTDYDDESDDDGISHHHHHHMSSKSALLVNPRSLVLTLNLIILTYFMF